MARTRKLIINADDFGMCPEVNEGILLTHLRGCVTSTSALVNASCSHDLKTLKKRAPKLGVGLHLNLTMGRPVVAPGYIPSIVADDGQFYSALELLSRFEDVEAAELERELLGQVQRFEELYGGPPDHLDVHQYSLLLFPLGLQLFAKLASALKVPVRCIKSFLQPEELSQLLTRIEAANQIQLKSLNPQALSWKLKEIWSRVSVPTPDCWEHRFHGNLEVPQMLALLDELPGGLSEWMCHPASRITGATGFEHSRTRECYLLTHPELLARLRKPEFELTTYASCLPKRKRAAKV